MCLKRTFCVELLRELCGPSLGWVAMWSDSRRNFHSNVAAVSRTVWARELNSSSRLRPASCELQHRKLTRNFSMQILAHCAQDYVLILLIEYFILWHDWARFLPGVRGERDKERQITTRENYQNLYFMAVFSVLQLRAFLVLGTRYLKQINPTVSNFSKF